MKLDEEIEMHGRMAIAIDMIEGCRDFAALIPEVRTNLVYGRAGAVSREDVLGIDGRITVVGGMPSAAGKVRPGASSHMARLIIEIGKSDPSVRAGIDFANDPHLAGWLEGYCRSKGWVFSCIDRSGEPDELKSAEGASMPWKVKAAIEAAGGRVPKIFYETGAVGKEPVSVLVGREPIEVARQICEIARLYRAAP
ncbi:MAG: Bifunctional thiamine biosynthesis protein ThiDN [Methanosaeta sp. PtaB.Bin039]|nr:MAG: Bifunctional thiamine biosynthesis protein ThiDN [Methanosaeta sp. PtaB.Bin039]HOT06691.1 thiamine-phosphate synthase family protein [Methanotrichaceae archaeon]HQF16341.1 thiamine-phosphate synthase family protein [Methanotrichaceae archaeon]HQI91045.1 thiamine-phosphate synthase family protein [Methanotrichaceae archaeon]